MTKFYILFLFLSFNAVQAKENPIPLQIQKEIKKQALKTNSLGMIISQIKSNSEISPVYKLNENKLFIPASLVKIASLSVLYDLYPISYTFKTSFVSSANIRKGALLGDLVLKGGGDSSFTSEHLWKLVNNLTRSGLKKVEGDLLIDDSLYKKEPALPYSERSYLALSSASSFNWNSVAFYIRPAQKLHQPALVFANPQNSYVEVVNKVKTGKKNKIFIKRRAISSKKEVFEIKGEINISGKEIVKYRNITKPALWLGHNVISFLNQRGLKVTGKVKKGACKGSCRELAEWESRPFPFHAYNMMKYSSNFIARMLVSHLPLLKGKNKGDLNQGMKKIRNHLKTTASINNFQMIEPSGLNRKNKFTPLDLQKILIQSEKKYYRPEMFFSYPLAQGKGTLSKRFEQLSSSAYVRAKTGSLYGILGLAGWAGDKNNKYVFVFIFNGRAGQSAKAQDLFDKVILSLTRK
ncbi:MAG: D-alanyl-D-alanine carboxypeptidase/D-alanyl-D-alanine-endopeptidase [Oligoflexia bacterium]|nr:D-alanyl-D-alanine carboxypeptidase/D-alanyl-D-alanine-endopeptidase [Oligoflexia bacterium]